MNQSDFFPFFWTAGWSSSQSSSGRDYKKPTVDCKIRIFYWQNTNKLHQIPLWIESECCSSPAGSPWWRNHSQSGSFYPESRHRTQPIQYQPGRWGHRARRRLSPNQIRWSGSIALRSENPKVLQNEGTTKIDANFNFYLVEKGGAEAVLFGLVEHSNCQLVVHRL